MYTATTGDGEVITEITGDTVLGEVHIMAILIGIVSGIHLTGEAITDLVTAGTILITGAITVMDMDTIRIITTHTDTTDTDTMTEMDMPTEMAAEDQAIATDM